MILMIVKAMKMVTRSFCSLPSPVLASLHTSPSPSKEGWVTFYFIDEENKESEIK